MLSKYSVRRNSATEIEDHYNVLGYLGFEDQYIKLPPEEVIAKKVKLIPEKRKTLKTGTGTKTNSK